MVLRLPLFVLAVLTVAVTVPDVRSGLIAAAEWMRDGFIVVFVDAANFVGGCF